MTHLSVVFALFGASSMASCGGRGPQPEGDALMDGQPEGGDIPDADMADLTPDAEVPDVTPDAEVPDDALDAEVPDDTPDVPPDADPPDAPSAETICDDGLDNDGDGAIDCLDSDCDGLSGCELGAERTCDDGLDNDGDGATDCTDSDCGAVDSCVIACPAGSNVVTYLGGGLPAPIADFTTTTSAAAVADVGVVTGVALRFSATHTFDADLEISLLSPSGTSIDVSSDNGGAGDNYTGTLFADFAATPVTAGTAPFAASFRPEQPFSTFSGEPTAGDWTLTVYDDAGGDRGEVTEYQIYLCWCMGTAGCEFGPACADAADNDGDALVDCADPDCIADPRCLPETNCADGIDDDFDGATDCADSDCDRVGRCELGVEISCLDGFDNDADGTTDCADADCASTPACAVPETDCGDGIDDDFDTLVDCVDPDCAGRTGCEVEPNDTAATANDLGVVAVNGRVGGRIGAAGDYDYYMLVVPAGSSVALSINTFGPGGSVACAAPVATTVNLYDSSGTLSLATDATSGPASCSHVPYVAAPGTYYVRVRATSATATFDYSLVVRAEPIPLPAATPEVEPNEDGTPSTGVGTAGNDFSVVSPSGPFSVDAVASGAISPAGDEDIYAITNLGSTTAMVFVETFGTAGWNTCGIDTVLHVRDAAGADVVPLDDDGGAGTCSYVPVMVPAGQTVYAQVLEFGDNGTLAAYDLIVSFP